MIYGLHLGKLALMKRLITALSFLLVTACTSVDTESPLQDFVFVFLKTGPAEDLSLERRQELERGHFANMDRLWDQGSLLIAGPFADPRPDPDNRGVFIFDVADVALAEDLTRTDPALQAGILRLVAYPFTTANPLREVYALDRADKDSGQPNIRAYVLAMSEDLDAAEAMLAGEDFVVFSGRFGGDLYGTALFALDAEDPAAARRLLRGVDPQTVVEWQLHPWYGSRHLTELSKGSQ